MSAKRTLVQRIACSSCDVLMLDMHDLAIAAKARQYGLRAAAAVVEDGRLTACCDGAGPNNASLRAAAIGVALP